MTRPAQPGGPSCEAIVGYFAWFSQTCGTTAVTTVPCLEGCHPYPHHHAVCDEHAPRAKDSLPPS